MQDEERSAIRITGDENLISAVSVNVDNGLLSINSRKNLKYRNIIIYIPVTTLKSLDLASGASVLTEGTLKLDGLKVLVHDGSKVALKVIGDFQIESPDDCEFVYEKYEVSNVVFVEK